MDIDAQFLDYVDLTCSYEENEAMMEDLLRGSHQSKWVLRDYAWVS